MKQFKLPKEFAERWVTALRSGKYQQGNKELIIPNNDISDENLDINNCAFCCLGVAGHISFISITDMVTHTLLDKSDFDTKEVPAELIEYHYSEEQNLFTNVLSSLNDGVNEMNYNDIFKELENLKFRHQNIHEHDFNSGEFKMNFTQIADFIEDNCEFYDEPVKQEKND